MLSISLNDFYFKIMGFLPPGIIIQHHVEVLDNVCWATDWLTDSSVWDKVQKYLLLTMNSGSVLNSTDPHPSPSPLCHWAPITIRQVTRWKLEIKQVDQMSRFIQLHLQAWNSSKLIFTIHCFSKLTDCSSICWLTNYYPPPLYYQEGRAVTWLIVLTQGIVHDERPHSV